MEGDGQSDLGSAYSQRGKTMKHPARWMAALLLAMSGARNAAAQDSTYSTFDYEGCPEAVSPEPDVIEVRRCEGPAGLPVYWHAEPDSSQIVIGDLAEPLFFEGGTFVFEVNNVVEWRWLESGTQWPQAAIVRYRYGRSVSDLSRSRLAIYMIEADGYSCVLDMVEGANANEKAREIADRDAGTMRCAR